MYHCYGISEPCALKTEAWANLKAPRRADLLLSTTTAPYPTYYSIYATSYTVREVIVMQWMSQFLALNDTSAYFIVWLSKKFNLL